MRCVLLLKAASPDEAQPRSEPSIASDSVHALFSNAGQLIDIRDS